MKTNSTSLPLPAHLPGGMGGSRAQGLADEDWERTPPLGAWHPLHEGL